MPDNANNPPKGPFDPKCLVHSTPVARRERLQQLGVPEELLVEALQRGIAEKLTAEIYDPATAGGYDLYRYTTRHLREGLHRLGWELSDTNNIALVREPIDGTALIVCSGDQQTGQLIGDPPKTKRSKGDVFLEVTEVVARDLWGNEETETRLIALPDAKVWLLLHYHAIIDGQEVVRAELSLPQVAEGGTITGWSERIILYVPLPDAMPDDETGSDNGPIITPDVKIRI